jgi:hypothetical protein
VQGKEAEEYLKQGTMVPASMIIGEHHNSPDNDWPVLTKRRSIHSAWHAIQQRAVLRALLSLRLMACKRQLHTEGCSSVHITHAAA